MGNTKESEKDDYLPSTSFLSERMDVEDSK